MSSLTGLITIQNRYHNMEVTMEMVNRYPIPNKETDPGDAMDQDYSGLLADETLLSASSFGAASTKR